MNEPESTVPDTTAPSELQQQISELRRLANFSFIGLVIVSVTLSASLGIQWWRVSKDLEIVRQQRAQLQSVAKSDQPHIDALVGQLVAYGQQGHPDYLEKLANYGIPTNGAMRAPSAAPKKANP